MMMIVFLPIIDHSSTVIRVIYSSSCCLMWMLLDVDMVHSVDMVSIYWLFVEPVVADMGSSSDIWFFRYEYSDIVREWK